MNELNNNSTKVDKKFDEYPLDIRDCDHCKHYVTRDGQTGCEKWECEFEKED